jgi:hypothetical protein
MSASPPVVQESGETWSFTYDLSQAPRYVLLSLHGQPTAERSQRILAVAQEYQSITMLPNGKLCPLIVDRRTDRIPSPEALEAGRALLEDIGIRLSFLIFLIDPKRKDRLLMDLVLEILSAFSPFKVATAGSLEEAIAKAEDYGE